MEATWKAFRVLYLIGLGLTAACGGAWYWQMRRQDAEATVVWFWITVAAFGATLLFFGVPFFIGRRRKSDESARQEPQGHQAGARPH
jgi:hypothetical protein